MRQVVWLRYTILSSLCVCFITQSAWAQSNPELTLLVTHPKVTTLKAYVSLVKNHIWPIQNIKLIGIHHASESENYAEATEYLQAEHINWISLQTIHCAVDANTLYNNEACRAEFKNLVDHSSGIIFNGGPDIPPVLYGKPTSLMTHIETPHRHMFEISLLANLLGTSHNKELVPLLNEHPDYPVMGICVGLQTMNVAAGGTLLQDIPSEVYNIHQVEQILASDANTWHSNPRRLLQPENDLARGVFHPVILSSQAPQALRNIVGNNPVKVMSVHHQAILQLADNYQVIARTPDNKIIEGIAHSRFKNVFGWQFHPEWLPLWEAQETERLSLEDSNKNFAYTTIHHDSRAKQFKMAIWQSFIEAMQNYGKTATPAGKTTVKEPSNNTSTSTGADISAPM